MWRDELTQDDVAFYRRATLPYASTFHVPKTHPYSARASETKSGFPAEVLQLARPGLYVLPRAIATARTVKQRPLGTLVYFRWYPVLGFCDYCDLRQSCRYYSEEVRKRASDGHRRLILVTNGYTNLIQDWWKWNELSTSGLLPPASTITRVRRHFFPIPETLTEELLQYKWRTAIGMVNSGIRFPPSGLELEGINGLSPRVVRRVLHGGRDFDIRCGKRKATRISCAADLPLLRAQAKLLGWKASEIDEFYEAYDDNWLDPELLGDREVEPYMRRKRRRLGPKPTDESLIEEKDFAIAEFQRECTSSRGVTFSWHYIYPVSLGR